MRAINVYKYVSLFFPIMSYLTHPILVSVALLHAATRVLNETYVTDGTCVRARVTSECRPCSSRSSESRLPAWRSPSIFSTRRLILCMLQIDRDFLSLSLCLGLTSDRKSGQYQYPWRLRVRWSPMQCCGCIETEERIKEEERNTEF